MMCAGIRGSGSAQQWFSAGSSSLLSNAAWLCTLLVRFGIKQRPNEIKTESGERGGAQGQKGKQRNELCCPRGKLALVCYVAAWFKNKGKQKEKKRKLGSVSKDFLQIKNSSLQTSLHSGDAELTADLCSSIRSHMHPCPALHGNHIPPHGPQIPPSPPHPQHGLPSRTAPTCVLVSPSVYFPTNAEGKGIIYKQRGKCLQGGALRKRHQIYYYYYYYLN